MARAAPCRSPEQIRQCHGHNSEAPSGADGSISAENILLVAHARSASSALAGIEQHSECARNASRPGPVRSGCREHWPRGGAGGSGSWWKTRCRRRRPVDPGKIFQLPVELSLELPAGGEQPQLIRAEVRTARPIRSIAREAQPHETHDTVVHHHAADAAPESPSWCCPAMDIEPINASASSQISASRRASRNAMPPSSSTL